MTQLSVNYGTVLYELSIPGEIIRETAGIFGCVKELQEALTSPVVSKQEKHAVIDRVFPKEIRNFLKEVSDNQDMAHIQEIFKAYHCYDGRMRGILEAALICVTEPEPAQLAGIKRYLLNKYQKKDIELIVEKDAGLIGGFIIRVGDMELDRSLKGRLGQLRQKLMGR